MQVGITSASEEEVTQPDRRTLPMRKFLEEEDGRVLILHDPETPDLVASLAGRHVTIRPVDGLNWFPEPGERWGAVLLAVPDRAALRRCASFLPVIGPVRAVACWLAEANQPVFLRPRADWPEITVLNARKALGGAITTARFDRQVSGRNVLTQLARCAAPEQRPGNSGMFVATDARALGSGPPADPATTVVESTEMASDPELDVPPDLVLVAPGGAGDRSLPVHHVIKRAPVVLVAEGAFGAPIDEVVINPRHFRRDWVEGVVDLRPVAPGRLAISTEDGELVFDGARGATERVVRRLRRAQGVRIAWPEHAVADHARVVAGLAMAGVPLVGAMAPGPARRVLGERLAQVLENPADLTLPLRREEYSIRLRRAALLEHSVVAWRQRVAAAVGVDYDAYPSVSILLATKRPHQLEFALKQIAKQQGADLELVLAAHGWTPDPERVRELLGDVAVTVLSIEQETSFGDVLNAAAAAASGELLLKFDDDDWYGPDVVSDLLLARNYSGADLVGSTAEFAFLEPLWRMIRRNDEAEREASFVAGGTMMLDRSTLHSLGGFRSVHKYVDASLLASAHAAGALVYRTHGLGYVMRRSAGGHTWQADLDYFLNPKRIASHWEGFVTSELLVLADDELPQRDQGEVS